MDLAQIDSHPIRSDIRAMVGILEQLKDKKFSPNSSTTKKLNLWKDSLIDNLLSAMGWFHLEEEDWLTLSMLKSYWERILLLEGMLVAQLSPTIVDEGFSDSNVSDGLKDVRILIDEAVGGVLSLALAKRTRSELESIQTQLNRQSNERLITEVEGRINKFDSLRESLLQEASDAASKRLGNVFDQRARAYQWREWGWAAILILAAFVFVHFIGKSPEEIGDLTSPKQIYQLLHHAIIISAAAIGVRVALNKYNAERHLRILYDHRHTAVSQLNIFLLLSGANPEVQQSLWTESVKMLLADPASNYGGGKSDGSEVTISPVIGALEKIVKPAAHA